MANYEALKANVDKNGEVMIQVDTGEEIEIPKHKVRFEDSTKEIGVDAQTKSFRIGADRVSYFWTHKQGIEKGKE